MANFSKVSVQRTLSCKLCQSGTASWGQQKSPTREARRGRTSRTISLIFAGPQTRFDLDLAPNVVSHRLPWLHRASPSATLDECSDYSELLGNWVTTARAVKTF